MPSIDCSMRELNWFHRKKITWHGWHSPPTEASAIQLAEALSKQSTSLINRFGNWVQRIWNICSRLLKSTWVLKYFHHAPKNYPHQLWPNPSNPRAICTRVTTNQSLKNKSKQQYQRFKLWKINPTTFDIFRHMPNLFPIRIIIHHGPFEIEGMQMMCNMYAQNRFHNLKIHFEMFEAPLTFYLVANCHSSEIYVWQIGFNFPPKKGWMYRKTMELNISIQNLRHSILLAGEWRSSLWLFDSPYHKKGRTGGLHHCSIETTKFWKIL